MRCFSTATGAPLGAPLVGHTAAVTSVAFHPAHPGGQVLLPAALAGTSRSWTAPDGSAGAATARAPLSNASDAALATTLQPAPTEEVLAAYRHAPIQQHSMYTTTNNELGIKKPTNATFSNERAARSQNFSNSFNGVKHRNQGLNCAMTKSGAHKNLDPQWI